MHILLTSSTEKEIKPFLLSGLKEDSTHKIDILITGVGIPVAMFHLTKAVLQKKYDLVIQAGIAGTFNKKIKPSEVVIVSQDTFAEAGAKEGGKIISLFNMGLQDANEYPYQNGWLINNHELVNSKRYKVASAVTISTITDDKKHIKQLVRSFSADIESMEGAVLHYVCLQQNIPFIHLRAISNKVGERDKRKWKMKKAITNLNKELNDLLKVE
jgi:futalosine hydrolase